MDRKVVEFCFLFVLVFCSSFAQRRHNYFFDTNRVQVEVKSQLGIVSMNVKESEPFQLKIYKLEFVFHFLPNSFETCSKVFLLDF